MGLWPRAKLGHAARPRFILEVWNPYDEWPCGRFDWNRAIGMWDDNHRKAFIGWLQKPFFP